MVRRHAALAAALALAGCGVTARTITVVETVPVNVPVEVRREPPAELVEPFRPIDLPSFTTATDPAATSCLAPAGETALKLLILDLIARDAAWRAWGAAP